MGLSFDVTAVKDLEENFPVDDAYVEKWTTPPPEGTMRLFDPVCIGNPVVDTVIWKSIAIGIQEITEDNVDAFWQRMLLYEYCTGDYSYRVDGEPFPFPRGVIVQLVGLKTNVSEHSFTGFMTNMMQQILLRLPSVVKDAYQTATEKDGKEWDEEEWDFPKFPSVAGTIPADMIDRVIALLGDPELRFSPDPEYIFHLLEDVIEWRVFSTDYAGEHDLQKRYKEAGREGPFQIKVCATPELPDPLWIPIGTPSEYYAQARVVAIRFSSRTENDTKHYGIFDYEDKLIETYMEGWTV